MHYIKNFLLAIAFVLPIELHATLNQLEIPDFTPNVVDLNHYLTQSEVLELNLELQKIRERSGIMPAVFVIESLNGESIENVATETFQKWKLGSKDFDNGLLLVIAMNEHKSRFEVGYGLEGSITDLSSRIALDEHLRPQMRKQQYKAAVIDAFKFLSDVRMKDPAALSEVAAWNDRSIGVSPNLKYGLISWLLFVIVVWLTKPVTRRFARSLAEQLTREAPYRLDDDPFFNEAATTQAAMLKRMNRPELAGMRKSFARAKYFIPIFLTINPGVFIFIFGMVSAYMPIAVGVVALLLFGGYFYTITSRYKLNTVSNVRYLKKLVELKQRNEEIAKMPMSNLKSSGKSGGSDFNWSSSSSSDWSSSSSSSSDSFSSSSDGGSSGGGGSSSDW